jgi:hypothetical protein
MCNEVMSNEIHRLVGSVNTVTMESSLGCKFNDTLCTNALQKLTVEQITQMFNDTGVKGYRQGNYSIGCTNRKVKKNKTKRKTVTRTFGSSSEFFVGRDNGNCYSVKVFTSGYIGITGAIPYDTLMESSLCILKSVYTFIQALLETVTEPFTEVNEVRTEVRTVTCKYNGHYPNHNYINLQRVRELIIGTTQLQEQLTCEPILSTRYAGMKLRMKRGEALRGTAFTLFATGKMMVNFKETTELNNVCTFLETTIKMLFNDTVLYNGLLNARYQFDSTRNGTQERTVRLGICNKRITKSVAVNSITESGAIINLDCFTNTVTRNTDSVTLQFNVNSNTYNVTIFNRGNIVISSDSLDCDGFANVFMQIKDTIQYDSSVQIKKKKYKKRETLIEEVK